MFIGEAGPRDLRVRKEGLVVKVVKHGEWWMSGARSEVQQHLMITLTTISPPNSSNEHDDYIWRRLSGSFAQFFSCKETWSNCDHILLWCHGTRLFGLRKRCHVSHLSYGLQ